MKKSQVLILCVGLLFSLIGARSARAQGTVKAILSFDFQNGSYPGGVSIDPSGNIWVATLVGGNGTACGTDGCGAVVELVPVSGAWVPKLIYNFHGGNDGLNPSGRLLFDSKGNVFGTTYEGGSACSCGVVYELSPTAGGWKENVIYRFDYNRNHVDGDTPSGGLVADAAGNLYGTTLGGGKNGSGTVYELTPNPHGYWTERVLWSFASPISGTDGSFPYSALAIDVAGNLYGTTSAGGANDSCSGTTGCGVVFELSPGANGTWTESIIHNFQNGTDGARSHAELIFDAAGNLFGTTLYGGSTGCSELGCGTVFKLSPVGDGTWTESVIYAFTGSGTDGAFPMAGVVFDKAGNLDGATTAGAGTSSFYGTVFSLTPSGGVWTETQISGFAFPVGILPNTTPVLDAAGNIYGTTQAGGFNHTGLCDQGLIGCGTLYQIKP